MVWLLGALPILERNESPHEKALAAEFARLVEAILIACLECPEQGLHGYGRHIFPQCIHLAILHRRSHIEILADARDILQPPELGQPVEGRAYRLVGHQHADLLDAANRRVAGWVVGLCRELGSATASKML